jgi:hypothetical protein
VVAAERIEPMPTDGPLKVTADTTFVDVPDPAVVIIPGGCALGAPTRRRRRRPLAASPMSPNLRDGSPA